MRRFFNSSWPTCVVAGHLTFRNVMNVTACARLPKPASLAQFRGWHSVAFRQHRLFHAPKVSTAPSSTQAPALQASYVQSRPLTSPRPAFDERTDQTKAGGVPIAGTRPLHGVTVVSLEQAIAAPFCTRQLAELGARVIKSRASKERGFCARL